MSDGAEQPPIPPPIRPAGRDDLDGLLEIEAAAFPGDRLTRRDFRHAIASPSLVSLAAGEAGRPTGYLLLQTRRGSTVARITSVAVAIGQDGRGLGRRLVEAAEQEARGRGCDRVRLEVRADNARAARLYEAAGYARFAIVGDYYDDGESAWRYEKRLSG